MDNELANLIIASWELNRVLHIDPGISVYSLNVRYFKRMLKTVSIHLLCREDFKNISRGTLATLQEINISINPKDYPKNPYLV